MKRIASTLLLVSLVSISVPLHAQQGSFVNPNPAGTRGPGPASIGNLNAPSTPNSQPFSTGQAATPASQGPLTRIAAVPSPTSLAGQPVTPGTASQETKSDPAASKSSSSLLQMFYDGGAAMYPIALCSFVLLIFVFERLISLRSSRVIPKPFVRRLIEQLEQQQIERDEAYDLCIRNPSPTAQVFAATLKKYGRPAVEVEQAALDAGERVANYLRRNLRVINAISNISPLLGLLGTVLGMIQSFKMITTANAMGSPELLASGISVALLTTAAGLLVAIPAYIAYVFFLGKTDRLIMSLDEYSQQLVDAISAEGLQENDTSKTRTRTRRNAA